MNAIVKWQRFQNNSPYFQAVKTDGEESLWKKIAADYDKIVYPNGQEQVILSHLTPFLKDTKSAIEIGAGTGSLTIELSKHVESLTAIDPSKSMIKILKQRLLQEGIKNVSIIQSRWEDAMPEIADVVIAGGCLYVFYDIERALFKMLRHAGSRVLITHIGNEGLYDFDYRLIQKLSITKPCLFPPLSILSDVLVQLKIPANIKLFFIRTRKNFNMEEWIKRCYRLFEVHQRHYTMLTEFLIAEAHQDGDSFYFEEEIPAAVIDIPIKL